jgi:sirohydrochlorin cobaltochelatase
MHVLILLAHGSRHPDTACEVADLAAIVSDCAAVERVCHAFLELSSPTLPEAIAMLVSKGATAVDVLPLFLNTGNHVTRDIPELVAQAHQQYPDVEFRLLPHIGAHPAYATLIETIVRGSATLSTADKRKRGPT